MKVHEISDSSSKSPITACASTLAFKTSETIDKSCALFINVLLMRPDGRVSLQAQREP
jgi:hypothetical protein